MPDPETNLEREYLEALTTFLADEAEPARQRGYELGRGAIASGLGVLDITRLHHLALERLTESVSRANENRRVVQAAARFFREVLSPFEATHRGFHETNQHLRQLIDTLEIRNRELARTNENLAAEMEEHGRTTTALRTSEARYRRLIETANDVIFHLTPDGLIASVNPAFEVVTGWPCAAWLGKPFTPLLHPEEVTIALQRFHEILRGQPPERWTYRIRTASGEYAFGEFTLAVEIQDNRPCGIFGIGRDITERIQAERALRESKEHYFQLFQQARQTEEDLRRLSSRMLYAQEEERTRISRELHDEVGQTLTAINMNLSELRSRLRRENASLEDKLAGSQQLLESSMENVHRFARELRPAILDDLGLLPALRSYVKAYTGRTGIEVTCRLAATIGKLDDERNTVIYRIVQESFNNIAKHAHARSVSLILRRQGSGVSLEVKDDGRGFAVDSRPGPQGSRRLGLLGMQERVKLVGGELTIESEKQRGTTVRAMIPGKAGAVVTAMGAPAPPGPGSAPKDKINLKNSHAKNIRVVG